MKYRTKAFLGVIAFLLFWFLLFYPIILPYMDKVEVYPLLAVIIYEVLFYLTFWVVSMWLLGEKYQHLSWKLSLVSFFIYHIFDSVEPPMILDATGAWSLSPSAIISWDYGISYPLKTLFGLTGPALFYITNLGFLTILLVLTIYLVKPTTLGKLVKKVLD